MSGFLSGYGGVAVADSGRRPEAPLKAPDKKQISRRAVLGTGAVLLGSAGLTAAGVKISGDARHAVRVAAPSSPSAPTRPSGKTKEYWVQADSFSHNLVPTGADQMMGTTFKPADSTYWAV